MSFFRVPLFLYLLTLIATVVPAVPAQASGAHDHHGHQHHHGTLDGDEQFDRLVHELEEWRARSMSRGTPDMSDEAVRSLGDRAIAATVGLVLERVPTPTRTQRLVARVRDAASHLNPIALGRRLGGHALRDGAFAVAMLGVWESMETLTVVLAVKYPALAALVPFFGSHWMDPIVFTTALTLPRAVHALRFWRRYGGISVGPQALFEHYLEQRRTLPIDWDVAIDWARIQIPAASDRDVEQEVRFAVFDESWLERRLPRSFRLVFRPRLLAQREGAPAISLAELEALCREHSIDLGRLSRVRPYRRVYASLLLQALQAERQPREALQGALLERARALGSAVPRSLGDSAVVIGFENSPDARPIVERAFESGALAENLRAMNETTDVLAQRFLWAYRIRRDEVIAELREQPGLRLRERVSIWGALFEIRRALESHRGLAGVVMSRDVSPEALAELVMRVEGLFSRVRARLGQLENQARCEALLRDHHSHHDHHH